MFRRPGGTHRHLHCVNETCRMPKTPKSCTRSTHSHPHTSENSRRELVNAQGPLLRSVNTRNLQARVINPQRIKYPLGILELLSLLVRFYPTAVWVRKWPGTWNLGEWQWLNSQCWWQAHTGPNVGVKSFSLSLCLLGFYKFGRVAVAEIRMMVINPQKHIIVNPFDLLTYPTAASLLPSWVSLGWRVKMNIKS